MNLYIYGAGGLGREVLQLSKMTHNWKSISFVDDYFDTSQKIYSHEVITFEMLDRKIRPNKNKDDFYFVIAVGEPNLRKFLYDKMIAINSLKPISLIHPAAVVSSNATIGEGVIINFGAFVSDSTVINNNVYLQPYSVVGHDSEIGIHSVISTFSSIGGYCSIGTGVFIGMNSAIIQNICVGDFCIVGMGSVVHKSIDKEMVVAGNPARELRRNESRVVFR
jgi:sugar O-acyltransferase (sialic acid O-acetyltransferase NeuD family)